MSKYTVEVIYDAGDRPMVLWDSYDGYQEAVDDALYYAEEWEECSRATVIYTGNINAKDLITFKGKGHDYGE